MAVKHSTITVGTSPTSLKGGVEDRKGAAGDITRTAHIQAQGEIFVGGEGVTTTNYGAKIGPGQTLSIDLGYGEELFAVAAGSVTVNVLHSGV